MFVGQTERRLIEELQSFVYYMQCTLTADVVLMEYMVMAWIFQVGFKPAGGIRTAKDATSWMILMKEELGDDWTKPDLFRIGASALLLDIERQIFHYVTGHYAATHELPMA